MNININIRLLNESSIEEVTEYVRCNWMTFVEVDGQAAPSDDQVLEMAKKSQAAFVEKSDEFLNIVAILGGKVIGSHFLTPDKDGSGKPIFHINNLYVKPTFRKQGIAKELKKYAEKAVKDKGCFAITTTVDLHNEGILKLNKELGYKISRYNLKKDLT